MLRARPAWERGCGRSQVAVAGAEALTVGGAPPEGKRVDVVVSRQAGLGRSARAYIAATAVKLLALRSPAGPGEAMVGDPGRHRAAGALADRRAERRARDPPAASELIR